MTARIAILGSCVTRDIWKLPPFTPQDRKAVLVLARTSLASLFAAPAPAFHPPAEIPPGLSPWEIRMVGYDLQKTGLARLVEQQPTHLILDLVDERFDLLRQGRAVAAYSWEVEQLGLREGPLRGFRRVPRASFEAGRLWRCGVRGLRRFLAAELPRTRVILHDARWATEHLDADGGRAAFPDAYAFWPGRPASIAEQNRRLDAYVGRLRRALPQAACVRAAAGLTLADSRHRWGLAPYHYVTEYYWDIWEQLQALGCR